MYDEDGMSSSKKKNVDINEMHEVSIGLQAVFDDMNEHLKENDPNYVIGVAKFLKLPICKTKQYLLLQLLVFFTFGMEGQ